MNRKQKALEFADSQYNIQVTGRHVEVTDSMKDYVIEKISRLERFMDRIIDVNVVMDIQKFEHRVEISLKIHNFKVSSQASTIDMYASIDKAVSKLEAQILRWKSKMQDHHAKDHPVINMIVDVIPNQENEEFDIDQPEVESSLNGFAPHRVVAQEVRPLKMLTKEEAVMKMELSGDSFLIYKNEADAKLKVIYRRKDGDYGIIDPLC